MRRTVAVVWHASFSLFAAALYFAFVLPRWWELMGDTSHTLGTVLRIVSGALIGLAALPVVFTLLRTRRPEYRSPQLALTLRTWSIILHVLAGVLIVGTAISEIWLSLDAAGPWLFGIYGAAAAIALLGMFAFHLAYLAELPPPPPKPLKPKSEKQRRGRRGTAGEEVDAEPSDAEGDAASDDTVSDDTVSDDTAEDAPADESGDDSEAQQEEAEVTAEAEEPETKAEEPESTAQDEPANDDSGAGTTNGKLRNRRPSAKDETTRRRRRRLRGGVAVED
jgi:hypothetical protein